MKKFFSLTAVLGILFFVLIEFLGDKLIKNILENNISPENNVFLLCSVFFFWEICFVYQHLLDEDKGRSVARPPQSPRIHIRHSIEYAFKNLANFFNHNIEHYLKRP